MTFELKKGIKYFSHAIKEKKKSYIFIHINKCGGTSIEQSIGQQYTIHKPLSAYDNSAIGKKSVVTTVRDPLDRFVSMYLYESRYLELNEKQLLDAFPEYLLYWRACQRSAFLMHQTQSFWLRPQKTFNIYKPLTIIKLENLSNEWKRIQTMMDIKADKPPHALKSKNKIHKKRFLEVLNLDLFLETFREDYINFGYEHEI